MSAMIIGALAYATGTATTSAQIADLTKRVDVLEKRVQASADYHACATRHLDRLESGARGNPPCQLTGM